MLLEGSVLEGGPTVALLQPSGLHAQVGFSAAFKVFQASDLLFRECVREESRQLLTNRSLPVGKDTPRFLTGGAKVDCGFDHSKPAFQVRDRSFRKFAHP
jgi:hypothetical protein